MIKKRHTAFNIVYKRNFITIFLNKSCDMNSIEIMNKSYKLL